MGIIQFSVFKSSLSPRNLYYNSKEIKRRVDLEKGGWDSESRSLNHLSSSLSLRDFGGEILFFFFFLFLELSLKTTRLNQQFYFNKEWTSCEKKGLA